MDNQKQKKSVGTILLVILLLIVTIASLILATYAWAKYTTTTGPVETTATVAKWNVEFQPENESFTGTYDHVVEGKIAPGTSGTFSVTAKPNDTEVCFTYTIVLDKLDFIDPDGNILPDSTILDDKGNEDSSDDITLGQFRSHIKFTNESGDDVTPGRTTEDGVETNVAGAVTNGSYHLSANNDKHTGATGSLDNNDGVDEFTWTWLYNNSEDPNYDEVDTAAGKYSAENAKTVEEEEINGLRMKVTYTATATQVSPE